MVTQTRTYLDAPSPKKFPVGKVAGVDAHTYSGSHVMHKLIEHIEEVKGKTVTEWRIACRPAKKGVYSFMGFRAAVTCSKCKPGKVGTEET